MEKRKLLLLFFFLTPIILCSQNITHSYTSEFAKLQDSLENKLGRGKMRTVDFEYLENFPNPFALQIEGNESYERFLKKSEDLSQVRILYLNNINFENHLDFGLNKLPNLLAIRLKGTKNLNIGNFLSSLASLESLVQVHFNDVNFGRWELNINGLKGLKVLTLDNCRLQKIKDITLNLSEFAISNSKKPNNLSSLSIDAVKTVKIRNCTLQTFPFGLGSSENLKYLDLGNTRIKSQVQDKIKGFDNLLYLNMTDAEIIIKGVIFSDVNQTLYMIRESDIIILDNSTPLNILP